MLSLAVQSDPHWLALLGLSDAEAQRLGDDLALAQPGDDLGLYGATLVLMVMRGPGKMGYGPRFLKAGQGFYLLRLGYPHLGMLKERRVLRFAAGRWGRNGYLYVAQRPTYEEMLEQVQRIAEVGPEAALGLQVEVLDDGEAQDQGGDAAAQIAGDGTAPGATA